MGYGCVIIPLLRLSLLTWHQRSKNKNVTKTWIIIYIILHIYRYIYIYVYIYHHFQVLKMLKKIDSIYQNLSWNLNPQHVPQKSTSAVLWRTSGGQNTVFGLCFLKWKKQKQKKPAETYYYPYLHQLTQAQTSQKKEWPILFRGLYEFGFLLTVKTTWSTRSHASLGNSGFWHLAVAPPPFPKAWCASVWKSRFAFGQRGVLPRHWQLQLTYQQGNTGSLCQYTWNEWDGIAAACACLWGEDGEIPPLRTGVFDVFSHRSVIVRQWK